MGDATDAMLEQEENAEMMGGYGEAADVAWYGLRGVDRARRDYTRGRVGRGGDMAGMSDYDADTAGPSGHELLPERKPSFRLQVESASREWTSSPRWSDQERIRLRSRRDEIEREIAALEAADAKYGHDDDYPYGSLVVVAIWHQRSLMGGGTARYAFLKVSADRWYGTGQRLKQVRMTWAEVRDIMESGEIQEGPYITKEYELLPDYLAREKG